MSIKWDPFADNLLEAIRHNADTFRWAPRGSPLRAAAAADLWLRTRVPYRLTYELDGWGGQRVGTIWDVMARGHAGCAEAAAIIAAAAAAEARHRGDPVAQICLRPAFVQGGNAHVVTNVHWTEFDPYREFTAGQQERRCEGAWELASSWSALVLRPLHSPP